jgi:uncharacterized membrane protein
MTDEVQFQSDTSITDDDKLWSMLSYILSPIVPIIVLLMEDKKSRPFLKYHAIQALAWGVIEIILGILVVTSCLVLVTFIAAIYWGIQAYKGEYVTIPVLTDFLRKQGWL